MSQLIAKIRQIVGENGLITAGHVSERSTNWLGQGERQALAIVRPASTDELSRVMKLCYQNNQSVVPIGGLTGLVEGTKSNNNELVISLERMHKIEQIDEIGATITVQAGVALQSVQEAAKQAGFNFPLDLGARGSANIGGLIATNAGGNQVIRYGMMREQVLGLEAVLADGTIISSMNLMLKNNAGYDLKQLFIGSEGTLGIVTRAVLRLRPKMLSDNTVLVGLNDFKNIPKILKLFASALGGTLNAFEVMWHNYYSTILSGNNKHKTPLPPKYAYYILIEATGAEQSSDTKRFTQILETMLENELILDAVIANSLEQRDALWAIRDDIMTLVISLLPAAAFDVSLPVIHMQEYVSLIEKNLQNNWNGKAKLAVFGHLGDCNIHLVVGTGVEGELAHDEVERAVYEPLAQFGGSVSAEHGIGLEKRGWLRTSRTSQEIALMRVLKNALDHKNILNPGKVFD